MTQAPSGEWQLFVSGHCGSVAGRLQSSTLLWSNVQTPLELHLSIVHLSPSTLEQSVPALRGSAAWPQTGSNPPAPPVVHVALVQGSLSSGQTFEFVSMTQTPDVLQLPGLQQPSPDWARMQRA